MHFFPSGPHNAPFIGHIDPLKISPKGEEAKWYKAHTQIDVDKLKVIGAQAGLLITFTSPERGEDSAHVIAVETVKPADVLAWNLFNIKNLSLDSIAQSKEVDAIVREFHASQQPRGVFKYIAYVRRLFDY